MNKYQTSLSLRRTEVHLHSTLFIDSPGQEYLFGHYTDFLSTEEELYFRKLKYEKRQYSYLLGRYCAKKALSMWPFHQNPKTCTISSGIFSQPILTTPDVRNIQTCITHSSFLGGAIAFPEQHPMGLDLEPINPDKEEILNSQMTTHEVEKFSELPLVSIDRMTLLWVMKEALSKVLRTGLTIPFELLEIESITIDGDYIYSTYKNFPQYQACSFQIRDHFCALAYPRKTTLMFDQKHHE